MTEALKDLRQDLHAQANARKARILQSFFKTGPGQYGQGDVFLGVVVPLTRKVAIRHSSIGLGEIEELLRSVIHEERLCALLILVGRYEKGDDRERERVYRFYWRNRRRVNNWDLVDLSAPNIVGPELYRKDRSPLYKLAISKSIWERRISVLATFYFIKQGDFVDALNLAGVLLKDDHDLMHKAVGWMLREIGKRNREAEERFLKAHYTRMPRTMLRYAIERFPEALRQAYLGGAI